MPEREQTPPAETSANGTVAAEKPPIAEKYKRIAVGATIAGVLLVFFLLVILIVQIVQLSTKAAEEADLKRLRAEMTQKIEEGELDLEYYRTEEALKKLARQNGWHSSYL